MTKKTVEQGVDLQKTVGIFSAISIIAGMQIGSGIFVAPNGIALGAGSVGLSLIIWALCGALSMLGSLCYVELGMLLPTSGGEYPYLLRSMGPVAGFLFVWVSVILIKPAGASVNALAFAEYLVVAIGGESCHDLVVAKKIIALCVICVVCWVNIYNVRWSTKLQVVTTAAKMLVLCGIIVGGFILLATGHIRHLSEPFVGSPSDPGAIVVAIYNGMWAFDGWNNLNYMTGELRNPAWTLPRAIVAALGIVTVLYVLTNVSYFTVLSAADMISSPTVAGTWAEYALPQAPYIIPLCVALSTFGGLNANFLASPRMSYAAAKNGHMLRLLSYVQINRFTPITSVLLHTMIAGTYIVLGDIGMLINFFSFALWVFYALTASCVIILRVTMPHQKRPYRVPLPLAGLFVLVATGLVLTPLIKDPRVEYLYAAGFILAGLVFYVPFILIGLVIPGMDKFNAHVQRLLLCVPPTQTEGEADL